MIEIIEKFILNPLSRLTGPIFDKELRIAARRKRYYFLRCLFILILLIFVGQAWMVTMSFSSSGSAAFVTQNMSRVSRSVVCTMAWLEFILLPLLAMVMMSTAVSQEVSKRTLDVLLSTPITATQIVLGKTLSCILQLMVLIGITLPIFGIIRVFGGVPWDFTLASLCVTLVTTCLYAAIACFYSTRHKHVYRVLTLAVLTVALMFLFAPGLISSLRYFKNYSFLPLVEEFLQAINPYVVMGDLTRAMMTADPQGASGVPWMTLCGWLAAGVGVIILLSVMNLRRTMVCLANNEVSRNWFMRMIKRRAALKSDRVNNRPVIAVQGHPVYWKELHQNQQGVFVSEKVDGLILLSLSISYFIILGYFNTLFVPAAHAVFVCVMTAMSFLRVAFLSAYSIAHEKQSRALPILLTTPITEDEIVGKKLKAILYKTLPFWILIAADVVIFTALRTLHPITIISVPVAIIPTTAILIAFGMYFGLRFKNMSTATAMTFILPVLLYCFIPCLFFLNPFVIAGATMSMGVDEGMDLGDMGFLVFPLLFSMGIHFAVFLALQDSTRTNMRKYVFNVSG